MSLVGDQGALIASITIQNSSNYFKCRNLPKSCDGLQFLSTVPLDVYFGH